MSKVIEVGTSSPVEPAVDPEVIAFREQFDAASPLDELVREGARRMLQAAIDAEVATFVSVHGDRRARVGSSPGGQERESAAAGDSDRRGAR